MIENLEVIREKIGKFKKFCMVKKNIVKLKDELGKLFVLYDKELIFFVDR